MLNEATYGTIGVQTQGVFGQKVIVSSFALGQFNDNTCPSTRSVLLDRILNFFGEKVPLKISMPSEFFMCKNDGSVQLKGELSFDCASNSMKDLSVTGGSGNYFYDWNPKTNILNPNSKIPTVYNLKNNTTYTFTVTDLVYGTKAEFTTAVKVITPPILSVRNMVREKVNSIRNINNYVLNYDSDNTYYWYRNNTENQIFGEDICSWKVPMGMTNFYVEAISHSSCKSQLYKIVVMGGLSKDNADFVEGITGSSIMYAYPSISSDIINISAQFNYETPYKIDVVDLLGNVVMNAENGTSSNFDGSIDVSKLSSGTYMIIIETPTDRLIKKFIKL